MSKNSLLRRITFMWPGWLNQKYFLGGLVTVLAVIALACSSTPAVAPEQPVAPAPAAPSALAPSAPQPSAPVAPAPAVAPPAPQPSTPETSAPIFGGELTIAVQSVDTPSGLPRFCTTGCAETIYMTGITDTLFNSKANPDGTVGIEPMLATEFTLAPSLEFGTFKLREGIQFHDGWGEMTAEDVAFSYNDANSVTNPESIHGQASDFAALIASIEPLDRYTVKLSYRNVSRGVPQRFSTFWRTAGIVSKEVFDQHGVEGMQDIFVGVGAFKATEWSQNKGIFLEAFPEYYGLALGQGPFIEKLTWLEIPDSSSRRAMLENGKADIIQVALKDVAELKQDGFVEQRGAQLNTIDNISFAGNYWEAVSALTSDELARERDISKPWVGSPFENGDIYDENTPSMQSSMNVRNALAHAIDRENLVNKYLGGFGFVNWQPYLAASNPNYMPEWGWDLDVAKARQLMADGGYRDGFEMDLLVGTSELGSQIGESVGSYWEQNLGVKVNLIKDAYSTRLSGLVDRSTNTPFTGCGKENRSNYPYDWAHGFVMSSVSAGGYGVGMEVPFASETYLAMSASLDKAAREAISAAFYEQNRKWALCVGIMERPIWSMFNPDRIVEWDQRPTANENVGAINNPRSIKLK